MRELWPMARPWILRAIEKGNLAKFHPLEDDVLRFRAALWIAYDDDPPQLYAAAVTQIADTDRQKVCTILACGGKQMRKWLPLLEGIEKYARTMGCDVVRLMGRKGWQKVLNGYSAKRVILEKDVS